MNESYVLIKERIKNALNRTNRDENGLRLIAVSKTKSIEQIHEVFDQGQRMFAENYVQELLEKMSRVEKGSVRLVGIEWHFIGTLQSNKVNSIVGKVSLIQSVDSVRLAQRISRRACALGILQAILLEVNLADEVSKVGFAVSSLSQQIEQIQTFPGLTLKGLMALPPVGDNAGSSRKHFKRLKDLFFSIKSNLPAELAAQWTELSMGTTADFEVAIEEGATMVRIGTAIFGARV